MQNHNPECFLVGTWYRTWLVFDELMSKDLLCRMSYCVKCEMLNAHASRRNTKHDHLSTYRTEFGTRRRTMANIHCLLYSVFNMLLVARRTVYNTTSNSYTSTPRSLPSKF